MPASASRLGDFPSFSDRPRSGTRFAITVLDLLQTALAATHTEFQVMSSRKKQPPRKSRTSPRKHNEQAHSKTIKAFDERPGGDSAGM
jgi:hypothetical protein